MKLVVSLSRMHNLHLKHVDFVFDFKRVVDIFTIEKECVSKFNFILDLVCYCLRYLEREEQPSILKYGF